VLTVAGRAEHFDEIHTGRDVTAFSLHPFRQPMHRTGAVVPASNDKAGSTQT
jgi:hypothetical protein